MPYDDGTEVPTDGDDRPMGGTNRLAGVSGLGIGFGVALLVVIVLALILTFVTGKPGPEY
jgi:hypothetical protein